MRLSNRSAPFRIVQGGFSLAKKPLDRIAFGVPQLENRCRDREKDR